MKEASLVKFYFARYFFLAFGLLQGLAATMLLLQFQDTPKNRFAVFCVLHIGHDFVFGSLSGVFESEASGHEQKENHSHCWSAHQTIRLG